jgi:hypothetical protein
VKVGVLSLALILVCIRGFADVALEPWPAKTRDFPDESPVKFMWGGFHICARERRDMAAADGGTYQFTVRNIKTDASISFAAQGVGAAVLERFAGYPQFEIWARRVEGAWSRHLYRLVGVHYRCVRIDDFTESASNAKNTLITTTLPGSDDRLYFVETRIP